MLWFFHSKVRTLPGQYFCYSPRKHWCYKLFLGKITHGKAIKRPIWNILRKSILTIHKYSNDRVSVSYQTKVLHFIHNTSSINKQTLLTLWLWSSMQQWVGGGTCLKQKNRRKTTGNVCLGHFYVASVQSLLLGIGFSQYTSLHDGRFVGGIVWRKFHLDSKKSLSFIHRGWYMSCTCFHRSYVKDAL